MPAVFLWRGLSQLVLYDGAKPWSGGNLSSYQQEWRYGPISETHKPSEHWAAYVRPSDQWGVGVLFPASSTFISYQYGGWPLPAGLPSGQAAPTNAARPPARPHAHPKPPPFIRHRRPP
jgi:hypothetical protein